KFRTVLYQLTHFCRGRRHFWSPMPCFIGTVRSPDDCVDELFFCHRAYSLTNGIGCPLIQWISDLLLWQGTYLPVTTILRTRYWLAIGYEWTQKLPNPCKPSVAKHGARWSH